LGKHCLKGLFKKQLSSTRIDQYVIAFNNVIRLQQVNNVDVNSIASIKCFKDVNSLCIMPVSSDTTNVVTSVNCVT